MELYPDQQQDLTKLRDAFRQFRSVLFQAPTGYGKTVLFSHITRQMHEKRRPVVVVVHRIELVQQVSAALKLQGVPHGILSPGYDYTDHPVQVASIFTLARRMTYFPEPYLLIIDESHHAIPDSTWGKVLQLWRRCYILGVTATPIRLDGRGLGDHFQTLVCGPTTQELIDAGRLSPFRILAPPTVDTRGMHLVAGDYKRNEAAARADKPTITGDVVAHYRDHVVGQRGIAFCVSVEHATHVADAFRGAGVRALAVDGKMSRESRSEAISSFRAGGIKVLCSCDLVSEGFDVPGIECGILLRPTASLGLFLQQVGRCLRVAPGKREAVILDHVGNTLRHGWPAADRDWTLSPDKPESKSSDGAVSVRVCPECFTASRSPVSVCPACGTQFRVNSRTIGRRDGELEELTADKLNQTIAPDTTGDRYQRELKYLCELGMTRGYHPIKARLWAEHVLRGRAAKKRVSLKLEGM